jgi:quercetin dioxygenase-like cupin family protein
VSSGRIRIHTEFYEPIELATGDSLYFDSMMGHAFIRVGDEPAFIINVISAGEDSSSIFPIPGSEPPL